MTAADLNTIAANVQRSQELRGLKNVGGAKASHHWAVTASRHNAQQFQITVGPGTVNDRMAAISYLSEKDPRGWTMPEDWPGKAEMRELYGTPTPPVVDRLLTERKDPPFLLLTTPSPDGKDSGDLLPVDDDNRPPFFRTRTMWDRELWRAVVFLTAKPGRYNRVENQVHFPIPTRNRRFRVHVGPRLPNDARGVGDGGTIALADLFLSRLPGKPATSTVYVRQVCFWSLWTANAETYLDFDPFLPVFPIPSLAGITVGNLGLDLLNQLFSQQAASVGELFESAASAEFWTAV